MTNVWHSSATPSVTPLALLMMKMLRIRNRQVAIMGALWNWRIGCLEARCQDMLVVVVVDLVVVVENLEVDLEVEDLEVEEDLVVVVVEEICGVLEGGMLHGFSIRKMHFVSRMS